MKYTMKCSCGDTMSMDAKNRPEAVTKFKKMMTKQAIDAHMKENHKKGQPIPTVEQCHAGIEKDVLPR